MKKYILVCVYLLLTVSGLVLMKLGDNTGSILLTNGNIDFSISLISLAGFVCYILSFLLFMKIVLMFKLSFIFPISAGAVQILTLLAAIFILQEEVSLHGIIGICIVIVGIVVMNIRSKREEIT